MIYWNKRFMLSKDNTCRARCSLNFGAIARETERERERILCKKSNVARNASRWNGSQLQEDVSESWMWRCFIAIYIDNVTRGKFWIKNSVTTCAQLREKERDREQENIDAENIFLCSNCMFFYFFFIEQFLKFILTLRLPTCFSLSKFD